MRIWNSEHTFNHSWETVVTAAWRKYPNPHNPSVTGLDVVDRTVDSEGRLKSHRLMTTNWGIPGWVAKLIGIQEVCYASEHSIVDPESKSFSVKARNVTLANVLQVDEQLVYTQHPTDPEKTLLRQEATVTVSGLPLCSKLEQMVTDSMKNNAGKGRQAMEWVIDTVKKEAKELTAEAQKCMDNVLPKSL
ncbi:PRELI domain containing protein 3B [Aplysia californica]|uniref:PRELI domain containing protein 3B n=1 Tax=Aplysia californica TaxID=6500 RepID=A0ABM0K0E0_APLCA|nr:PRELI domain containing protein 3B [Aplysia californica]